MYGGTKRMSLGKQRIYLPDPHLLDRARRLGCGGHNGDHRDRHLADDCHHRLGRRQVDRIVAQRPETYRDARPANIPDLVVSCCG